MKPTIAYGLVTSHGIPLQAGGGVVVGSDEDNQDDLLLLLAAIYGERLDWISVVDPDENTIPFNPVTCGVEKTIIKYRLRGEDYNRTVYSEGQSSVLLPAIIGCHKNRISHVKIFRNEGESNVINS